MRRIGSIICVELMRSYFVERFNKFVTTSEYKYDTISTGINRVVIKIENADKNIENIYNSFGRLLKKERNKLGVTLEALCEGLMDATELSKIEGGARLTDTAMKNRLTDRLGLVFESEGTFLFYDDYEEWIERWDIIKCIEADKIEGAYKLLDSYRKHYKDNIISQQFYQVMNIQCHLHENASEDLLDELYEQAVKLTVPGVDSRALSDLKLSVDELNLVLEYRDRGISREYGDEDFFSRYNEILNYITEYHYSVAAKAKIYPKTVIYMYRQLVKHERERMKDRGFVKELLRLCNVAFDLLREEAVSYYMCEILGLREELLLQLNDKELADELSQTREWLSALRALYEKNGLSAYMRDDCYFYKDNSVYNIGDIVRARRKMYGMTMQQLYEGICSEKTLRRLEHNRTRTQAAIIEALFNRLNMTMEYQRMGIIADNRIEIELYSEFKRCCNNKSYEKARDILLKLKECLPRHRLNEQFIEQQELLIAYGLNELTLDEYVSGMKTALEKTVPLKYIYASDRMKYLTSWERDYVYSISIKLKKEQKYEEAYEYIKVLYEQCMEFEENGLISNNIRDYEFVMSYVASLIGSMGDYEESNRISEVIIREGLRYGRIHMIDLNIYNIAWNNEQRNGDKKAYNDGVYQSMLWSQLANDDCHYEIYKKHLKDV